RLRDEITAAQQAEPGLVDALDAAAERRAVAELRVKEADAALRAAEAERREWSARADALSLALDQARARAGAERLADLEGALGTLIDLVDVDEGWEAAFEAAAGEALAAVVVDGPDTARRALRLLKDGSTPGAVLAIGSLHGAAGLPLLGEPLRDHVRATDPAVEDLLDGLLASAV